MKTTWPSFTVYNGHFWTFVCIFTIAATTIIYRFLATTQLRHGGTQDRRKLCAFLGCKVSFYYLSHITLYPSI
jgi:hypothetical protein